MGLGGGWRNIAGVSKNPDYKKVSEEVSCLWMLFSTCRSVCNRLSWSLPTASPANLLLHFLLASHTNYWSMWLLFFKLSEGFAWWDHPTVFTFCLPTILLHGIESKSIWKWDERKGKFIFTLNHIPGAEIRSHLLGRETVCVTNKAQPPWHIQSLMSLAPGFGTRGPRLWPGWKHCPQLALRQRQAAFN